MIKRIKTADSLTVQDLQTYPVWEYVMDETDTVDETAVRPVETFPVEDLDGRIVGTEVRLANGAHVWGAIANLDTSNPRRTLHFLSLAVACDEGWFHLARYHDYDYDENGPAALSERLNLPLADVFPISYDLTRYVRGDAAMLKGAILAEPLERLSREEIISLAVI